MQTEIIVGQYRVVVWSFENDGFIRVMRVVGEDGHEHPYGPEKTFRLKDLFTEAEEKEWQR